MDKIICNARQAAEYCKQNNFSRSNWSCGYVLEVLLNDVNIYLDGPDAWQELEEILHYGQD